MLIKILAAVVDEVVVADVDAGVGVKVVISAVIDKKVTVHQGRMEKDLQDAVETEEEDVVVIVVAGAVVVVSRNSTWTKKLFPLWDRLKGRIYSHELLMLFIFRS